MTTSKGTIQRMTFVTATDEKHQIIIGAQDFGMGQEQATLKPTIEGIKRYLGETIFDTSVVLTADTDFSSEANMQYLFNENINAVIPDNQLRKRNPVFSESDLYNKHKALRKKTRRGKSKISTAIPNTEFTVDLNSNVDNKCLN